MAKMGALRGVALVGAAHERAPFEPVGPAARRAAPSLPPGRAHGCRFVPNHRHARDAVSPTGGVGGAHPREGAALRATPDGGSASHLSAARP